MQAAIGVVAMVIVGLVDTHIAFYNPDRGVDRKVVFLLFGMMVIVGFLPRPPCRLPRRVVGPGLRRGPVRLMALLIVVTATASALQDNVTAVLLAAPVVLHVCGQPAQFRARLAPT